MVSRDLGKLEAMRQRTADCACTAGATPAASTPARPACLMRERRSMVGLLVLVEVAYAPQGAGGSCGPVPAARLQVTDGWTQGIPQMTGSRREWHNGHARDPQDQCSSTRGRQ